MHYEDGLVFCDRAGYRPEYAWTACDYADALLTRNHPADRAKATALQDAACEIASKLGMRPGDRPMCAQSPYRLEPRLESSTPPLHTRPRFTRPHRGWGTRDQAPPRSRRWWGG